MSSAICATHHQSAPGTDCSAVTATNCTTNSRADHSTDRSFERGRFIGTLRLSGDGLVSIAAAILIFLGKDIERFVGRRHYRHCRSKWSRCATRQSGSDESDHHDITLEHISFLLINRAYLLVCSS
jgi:hypothetical protein